MEGGLESREWDDAGYSVLRVQSAARVLLSVSIEVIRDETLLVPPKTNNRIKRGGFLAREMLQRTVMISQKGPRRSSRKLQTDWRPLDHPTQSAKFL